MYIKVTLALIALAVALPLLVRGGVELATRDRIYPIEEAPHRRVALVFGAQVNGNYPSAMLADRIKAAAALYEAGRVDVLLMTGDNSTAHYNEPRAMRDYALALGIPADAIVLDYGGRRTYDSCYRARHIFQVEDAVLVTQRFHLSRALMTCRALDINAIGVAADSQRLEGYSRTSLTYSRLREFPATVLALIDTIRRVPPPVMGEPLPIEPPHEGLD